MVELKNFVPKLKGKVYEKFNNAFEKLVAEYPPDVAMVLAFEQAVLGSVNAVEDFRQHFEKMTHNLTRSNNKVDPKDVPLITINDRDYFLVPKMITVSGVNSLLQFKSEKEVKKIAKNQNGHIIPCVNDHPSRPKVDLEPHEISGFIFGVHGRDMDNGEYGIFGIDAIPAEYPELLDTYGDSIGYRRTVAYGWNSYKEVEYYEKETDITIVHNARMVNQYPAVPPDVPKYKDGEAHGVGTRLDFKNDPNMKEIMESLNAVIQKSPKDIKNCYDDISDETEVDKMEDAEKIKVLEDEVKNLKKQIKDQEKTIKDFQKNDVESTINSLEEENKNLKTKVEEQGNSIQGFEVKIAENNAEIERLKPFEAKEKERADAENKKIRESFKKAMKNDREYWTDEKINSTDPAHLKEILNAVSKSQGNKDGFNFDEPIEDEEEPEGEEGKKKDETENKYNRPGGSVGLPGDYKKK